ncbi:hypothetical protein F4825DRAFT_426334 [Nemania diffusa]|nr:hypothetical protein F4825DRAFT_426334 [Nemania diffusa]
MSATLETLRGRRQIFIVDNSTSMSNHWEPVMKTVRALAYLTKHMSPRGFDVHMTNGGKKVRQKTTKGLFSDKGLFQKHHPSENRSPCQMESALSNILVLALKDEIEITKRTETHSFGCSPWKQRGVHGIDVYILTNGIWEPSAIPHRYDEAGGVEHPIQVAVTRLKQKGFARTFLSIQFIRFGEDSVGMRRLSWLDDNIQDMVGGWDIVDTTPHEGDVSKMLIGSKSERTDNQEDGFTPHLRTSLRTSETRRTKRVPGHGSVRSR